MLGLLVVQIRTCGRIIPNKAKDITFRFLYFVSQKTLRKMVRMSKKTALLSPTATCAMHIPFQSHHGKMALGTFRARIGTEETRVHITNSRMKEIISTSLSDKFRMRDYNFSI